MSYLLLYTKQNYTNDYAWLITATDDYVWLVTAIDDLS